jgi:hypothetical protein
MAEFWRALRTLKVLQAEQAAGQAAAHVLEAQPPHTHPMSPTPRPPLARQPNEPERAAVGQLPYAMPDQPLPGHTLHEPAAPWMPNEPDTDRLAPSDSPALALLPSDPGDAARGMVRRLARR